MHGRRSVRALVAAYALVVGACSGGGDSGTAGGGGGGSGGITVNVDRTSFSFAGFPTYAWPSQRINFTLVGGSGTYYGQIVQDRADAFSTTFQITGPTTAYASLTPFSLPMNATTGNVTFRLCDDAACASVAWSKAIPYSITVFSASPNTVSIPGYEGSAATQAITITPPDDGQVLTASVTSGAFVSVTRRSASQFDVTASAVGLAAGSYQGTIQLAPPASKGAGRSFPVAFSVSPGIVAPAPSTVTLRVGSGTTGSIPVAFQGGIAPAWTATSDRAWLALGASSGTGPGAIPFSIDVSKLGSIPNWGSDVATVRINSAALTDATAQVTLQVELPEIHMISPPAVVAGQAATVTVFGRGLSQLTDPGAIAVGGASGAASTYTSDTQATVELPALAEGRHAVSVSNAFGVATPSADVGASALGAWTSATVAQAGEKRCAFYDPTRAAVYAVDSTNAQLVRYRYAAGVWQVDASATISSIGNAALSADGRTIWVASGTSTLVAVDPDTLAVGATTYPLTLNSQLYSMADTRGRTPGLQVTNDARLWFDTTDGFSYPFYFDTLRREFSAHAWPMSGPLSRPRYAASGDGSRMIISEPSVSPQWNGLYTSETDAIALMPTTLVVYGSVVMDGAGRHALVGSADVWLVDGWTKVGKATVTSGYGLDARLSPDGARLYVAVVSTSSGPIARIDVFDTGSVVSGTTNFVKVGELSVPDVASTCGATAPMSCISTPVFAMSPLGDAIFLVGNQALVVVPIP